MNATNLVAIVYIYFTNSDLHSGFQNYIMTSSVDGGSVRKCTKKKNFAGNFL